MREELDTIKTALEPDTGQVRCAECTCERGGDDCDWIKSKSDTVTGWQDISTAPKDGTWFLGFEPRKRFCDQFRVWRWVETNSFVGFEDAADTNDFDEQPTHWKPLDTPLPPAPEKEG